MPDYDLGRAHGRITADYDGSGIRQAKDDIDSLANKSSSLGSKFSALRKSWNFDADSMSKSTTKMAAAWGLATGALGLMTARLGGASSGILRLQGHQGILASIAVLLGRMPLGTSNFPVMIKRIIGLSAAVALLGNSTAILSTIASRFGVLEKFSPGIKRLGDGIQDFAKPVHIVRQLAVSFGLLFVTMSLVRQVIKYVSILGAGIGALAGIVWIITGLAQAIGQLAGIAGFIPGILFGLVGAVAAVAIGFMGMGKAITEGGEALAKLPPQARAFAQSIRDLQKPFETLQKNVQNTLFKDLAADIKILGQTFIPILSRGLGNIAQQFNFAAKEGSAFLKATQTQKDFREGLDLTAGVVHNMAVAVRPLLAALRDIGIVGLQAMRDLTGGVGSATEKFALFINQARRSGALREWIDDAVQGFKDLGGFVASVSRSLKLVFEGLSGGKEANFLKAIRNGAEDMERFLRSADGAKVLAAMAGFIDRVVDALKRLGKAFVDDVLPVLEKFGPIVEKITTSVVNGLVKAVAILGPLFSGLASVLGPLMPVLGVLLGNMVAFVAVLAGLKLAGKIGAGAMLLFANAANAIRGTVGGTKIALNALRGELNVTQRAAVASGTAFAGSLGSKIFGPIVTSVNNGVAAIRKIPGVTEAAASGGDRFRAAMAAAATVTARVPDAVGKVTTSLGQMASTVGRQGGVFVSLGNTLENGLAAPLRKSVADVDRASGAFSRFGGALRSIGSGIATGVGRALSGIMGVLGGPWGLVLTAATVALGIFMGRQQDAAEAARVHKEAIDDLAGTLNKSTGAMTNATKEAINSKIANDRLGDSGKTVAQVIQDAGLSVGEFSRAALGSATSITSFNRGLREQATTLIQSSSIMDKWGVQVQKAGLSTADLTELALGNQEAWERLGPSMNQAGLFAEDFGSDLNNLVGPLAEIAGKLGEYTDNLDEATRQTQAAAEAIATFEERLKIISTAFAGLRDGAPITKELANNFKGLAGDATTAATAAGQAAEELNGVGFGGAAAAESMKASRAAFISAAEGAGISAQAAAAMADQIGLIPTAAKTIFELQATGATAELAILQAQLAAVPGSKSVVVNMLSEQAQAQIRTLGFEIKTLPNGQSEIIVKDEAGRAKLNAFIETARILKVTLGVDANINEVTGKIQALITDTSGRKAVIDIDGNAAPVNGVITGAITFADGSTGVVTIDGNQKPVDGKITATIRRADGSVGTITLNPRDLVSGTIDRLRQPTSSTHTIFVKQFTSGTRYGSSTFGLAGGGIVEKMAPGGIRGPRLTPMSGRVARIVPANTWRVIGDRLTGREGFIPINRSDRSKRILQQIARMMGFMLSPLQSNHKGGINFGKGSLGRVLGYKDIIAVLARMQTRVTPMVAPQIVAPIITHDPYARPTGPGVDEMSTVFTGPINVTIDAKTVAEMRSVSEFFGAVQQRARAGKVTA